MGSWIPDDVSDLCSVDIYGGSILIPWSWDGFAFGYQGAILAWVFYGVSWIIFSVRHGPAGPIRRL